MSLDSRIIDLARRAGQEVANRLPTENVMSKGSSTIPVYFDGEGKAKPISSYAGNAATATNAESAAAAEKAAKDATGNVITETYATRAAMSAKQDAMAEVTLEEIRAIFES